MTHQTKHDPQWYDAKYSGEDRDDGQAKEFSIIPDADSNRLDLLMSNVGFDGHQYDTTFSLDQDDARQLVDFINHWLASHHHQTSN